MGFTDQIGVGGRWILWMQEEDQTMGRPLLVWRTWCNSGVEDGALEQAIGNMRPASTSKNSWNQP